MLDEKAPIKFIIEGIVTTIFIIISCAIILGAYILDDAGIIIASTLAVIALWKLWEPTW